MFFLRQFSIKQRLVSLFLLIILSFLVIGLGVLSQAKSNFLVFKKQQTEYLVESAMGLTMSLYEKVKQGELSEAEAKSRALGSLRSMRFEGDNYFFIQTASGGEETMIMHPAKPSLEGKRLADIKDADNQEFLLSLNAALQNKQSAWINYKWITSKDNKPEIKTSYGAAFRPWNWTIVSGMYMQDVEHLYQKLRIFLLISIGGITAICIVAGALISNSIIQPLNVASGRMKEIASGDGDLTQQLSSSGKDEITMMSNYFNNFIGKMRTSISAVSSVSENIFSRSENIHQISEKTKTLNEKQNQNTIKLAASIEEMSQNINAVSHSAADAKQLTENAQLASNDGHQSLRNTINDLDNLVTNIGSVDNVINELSSETENIGAVLDVIRSIAEQTNLLALNAAIEAARAGEQGRGFAVVADEVRTLASRTGNSTDEIQAMIEKLQSGSRSAVNAVKDIQVSSDKTKQQASLANDSLKKVDEIMNEVTDRNCQIASAITQQATASNDVAQSINELSITTEESVVAITELTDASEQLENDGTQMKQVVKQFVI